MNKIVTSYKLVNKDGLFSRGGNYSSFANKGRNGKTWSSIGYLFNHLLMNNRNTEYLKNVSIVVLSNGELSEEDKHINGMCAADYLEYRRKKEKKKRNTILKSFAWQDMRRYVNLNHYKAVENELGIVLSETQRNACNVFGMLCKAFYNYNENYSIENFPTYDHAWFLYGGFLSSWDSAQLIALLVACDRYCLRVSIAPYSVGKVRICFYQREREGDISESLPDLKQIIKKVEGWFVEP